MADRTTINVTKAAHREAKQAKRDGESWSDFIKRCTETDAPMQESMQVEIDADEVMDRLRDDLDDLLTIQVDVDLSDESDLSEEDVKRIVRDHIERSVHERARDVR